MSFTLKDFFIGTPDRCERLISLCDLYQQIQSNYEKNEYNIIKSNNDSVNSLNLFILLELFDSI